MQNQLYRHHCLHDSLEDSNTIYLLLLKSPRHAHGGCIVWRDEEATEQRMLMLGGIQMILIDLITSITINHIISRLQNERLFHSFNSIVLYVGKIFCETSKHAATWTRQTSNFCSPPPGRTNIHVGGDEATAVQHY